MKLTVKFPTRERPEKFKEIIESCKDLQIGDVKYVVNLDHDDPTAKTLISFCYVNKIEINFGYSENKVHAINRDTPDFDVLLLLSDDMHPVYDGWDERIIDDMMANYPDTDGMLWYNDGFVEKRLYTLPILGKKYYDRFGYIYNPEYVSLWCDNEMMEVGRERLVYFEDVLFEHRHPANVGYGKDKLYDKNEAFFNRDKEVFLRRKANGFINTHSGNS